jgi:ribonuclease R
MVAVLSKRGRFLVAEPLFGRGPRTAVDPRGAREGDLVLVGSGKRGARVVRELGRPDVARDVLEGLMIDRGLRRAYARSAADEAEFAAGEPFAADARVDLTALPTFTIDPPDAKDLDDAISARRVDGMLRVWVHIADVTAYLRPGGALEREAFRRATSVYVPGAVEPMLPEVLSSGACSLQPGEPRHAVTLEIDLDGGGVRRTVFHRSLIRNDARLTYGQVDEIFAGRRRAEEPWAEPLAAAREAAAALGKGRQQLEVGGAPEPVFEFDSDGHVTGVQHEADTESHRLIERLMILANEEVAAYLEDHKLPTLYRVHERPDPSSVEVLLEQLASLDLPTPSAPERMSPQQAAEVVTEASALVAREAGERQGPRILLLRTLKQAHYSPRNVGHTGLGSARYCHFTSPIRRWPDVVAHRALLQGLGIDHAALPSHDLPEAAELSSTAEREAMKIERDADDVGLAFLLERQLVAVGHGEPPAFPGEVVGLVEKGAFVRFGEEGFEGFLGVRRLRGWWTLNELGTALEAEGSGRRLRLGDPVDVSVDRVEAPRGRVDLGPAGSYSGDG